MKPRLILSIAIVLALCIGLASGLEAAPLLSRNQASILTSVTTTTTTTIPEIQIAQPTTMTTIIGTTATLVESVTNEQIAYAPCEYTPSSDYFILTSQPNSSALLCVQFFYYNSSSTTTIDPLSRFQLPGGNNSPMERSNLMTQYQILVLRQSRRRILRLEGPAR